MNVPASRPLLSLPDLLSEWVEGPIPDLPVQRLCLDTRELEVGDVFVALRGHAVDGREFLAEAARAGAVAALVEDELPMNPILPAVLIPGLGDKLGMIAGRFYGEPSRHMHVTAITGTNGKTTVSQLLAQFVRAAGYDCGVVGTLGASLDAGALDTANTTPDAITLQSIFASWAGKAVPFVAMEASSHALVQGRMNGVEVDTAVFTNLSRDHLDYHGSMAEYGAAKARLFQVPGLRKAAINADDPFSTQLEACMDSSVQRFRYGQHAADLDVKISALQQDRSGMRLRIESDWGKASLSCSLLGAFNAMNLAAAFAAGLQAGLPFDALVASAEGLRPIPGRMEPVATAKGPLIVVDYAHTPDALTKALKALRPLCSGRLIAVFGCGGDRDSGKRALMAEAVSASADYAVVTSDNPRTEAPEAILAQIATAMAGDHELCEDRGTAIERAIRAAKVGDCVLIAGKGHEAYQQIGDRRLSFSDSDVARRVIAQAGL